jgi:oxygen-independent coproporphyrinogen-3 oxidase
MKKTDSNEKRGGIYIHIPFCVRKCAYCDFLSAPADEKTQAGYVKALQTEIYQTAKLFSENPYTVDTVFFGGGTPSILAPKHIKALMDTLRECFTLPEAAEITIECNPGTLDEDKAAVYKQAGINRISFGLQSANNRELEMLGRIHTMEEFVKSYETARVAGFDNINIDLMSALPGQTFESFLHTLDTVLALMPEHISMYSLILEEGTALYEHLDRYPALPDEDTERQMYDTACCKLADNSYHQYEISNFAKEGKACRHNLSYWERKNYLGFGVGAASLLCEQRYTNTDSLALYMDAMNKLISYKAGARQNDSLSALSAIRTEQHTLSVQEQMEEMFFLGLRKNNGISEADFWGKFKKTVDDVYAEVLEKNQKFGLLVRENGRIFLTKRGREVSNVVMSEFLLD